MADIVDNLVDQMRESVELEGDKVLSDAELHRKAHNVMRGLLVGDLERVAAARAHLFANELDFETITFMASHNPRGVSAASIMYAMLKRHLVERGRYWNTVMHTGTIEFTV